jgi:flagellar motility protein MotE (MotC chaperone)
MDFFAIRALRENHAGWSLLRADTAPLALSFFMAAFTVPNRRNLGRQELIDTLDDVLFRVRESLGEKSFPKPASEYLDDWAHPEKAWLRKYYAEGRDEPVYDLTAATEDVVRWVESLEGREFVATQSRLTGIFALLKALVQGSETNPAVRLAELKAERDRIDAEMERVASGEVRVMPSSEALDHFQQLTGQAKDLLADFREVEQNFRALDREVRERIATWEGTQGELLEDIFANRQDIAGSLQGRTFQGLWDYLMSPSQRAELLALLERATRIEALQGTAGLESLATMHQDWLPAVEQTQATVRRLSQQMRRLLDDKVFLENKRIITLIRSIEAHALALRDAPPREAVAEMPAQAVDVGLPFERPLYSPTGRTKVDDAVDIADDTALDADALFGQFAVDRQRLRGHIDALLETAEQASLADIVEAHPIEQGLAEVVGYFQLAAESPWAMVDGEQQQHLTWTLPDGQIKEALVERVIFVRPA